MQVAVAVHKQKRILWEPTVAVNAEFTEKQVDAGKSLPADSGSHSQTVAQKGRVMRGDQKKSKPWGVSPWGDMPASVWMGHIAFGLITIPVRLVRAARSERVPEYAGRHLFTIVDQ